MDQVCEICHRKFYKEGVKKLKIQEKSLRLLNNVK